MISRPDGLIEIYVEIDFNFRNFSRLEIDLNHINQNNRSWFTWGKIKEIVFDNINGLTLLPSATQFYQEEKCGYFVHFIQNKGIKYKLVFCICSDKPNTIGIITFFRYRGHK